MMQKKIPLIIFLIFIVASVYAQADTAYYPVRVSSFEAGFNTNSPKLRWKTVCNLSYARFQIQKSANGTDFSTINSFVADKARCQQPFEFYDTAHSSPGNVFYRINVGDIDGNFYHSRIIKVLNKPSEVLQVSVFPSVITSKANLVLSSANDSRIQIRLLSSTGAIVKQYLYSVKKGVSNYSLDFADVSHGQYWIAIVDSKGMTHSVPVIRH